MFRLLLLLMLTACTTVCASQGAGPVGGATDQPTAAQAEAQANMPAGVHASAPTFGLKAVEFHALSHDGSMRRPNSLRGAPTVMWFFPFAGTPG